MPAHVRAPHVRRGASPLARYTLGSVLGRGGMGEVSRRATSRSAATVAIKRMRDADASTPTRSRGSCARRASRARLEHPAIVPVYELWHDDAGAAVLHDEALAGVTLAT